MPDILIRNVSPETSSQLKESARRNQRSMQAEALRILEESLRRENVDADFWSIADRILEQTRGRHHTDSAELIREDRDSDHGRDA